MTTPPYLTQSNLRDRRRRSAKRLRRARVVAAVVVIAAIAGGVLLVQSTSRGTPRASHHAAHAAVHAVARQPLSADGLPLSRPALALTGMANPLTDPVQMPFANPPRAGMLFNLATGQVLWERDPHLRLPIASLTKMMTAHIAVASDPPSTPVLITRRAIDTNGSKVGVLPLGHHVSLNGLLYGLLLPSGNDAAVAIAEHVSGTVRAFVARMNAEAASLGMGCTRYSSPHGYYNAGNFSCAADLAVLAHVDMGQPLIAHIARHLQAALPFPIKGGRLFLDNNNPLLIYHYPGTTGLKTGYTEAAGRCLVATAERDGVRLGVVLLHSPAPATQASALLNAAFRDVYHLPAVAQPPIPADA